MCAVRVQWGWGELAAWDHSVWGRKTHLEGRRAWGRGSNSPSEAPGAEKQDLPPTLCSGLPPPTDHRKVSVQSRALGSGSKLSCNHVEMAGSTSERIP